MRDCDIRSIHQRSCIRNHPHSRVRSLRHFVASFLRTERPIIGAADAVFIEERRCAGTIEIHPPFNAKNPLELLIQAACFLVLELIVNLLVIIRSTNC